MALAYFFKAGASLEPQGQELYERYPTMRDWCDQAAGWIGMTGSELLSMEVQNGDPLSASVLRNVVVALGVADVLTEAGIQPRAVAGFCGGIMPAACVAGCLERKDLIQLVARIAEVPDMESANDPNRPSMVAQLAFPAGTPESHIRWFYSDEWPDVHLAADAGLLADGSWRVITVAGYQDDLERLATHVEKKEHVKIYGTYGAVHSPEYMPVRQYLEPYVRALDFQEPKLPVFDGFSPDPISTVDGLTDAFIRCYTDPVWLDHVRAGLKSVGTRLTIAPGPGSPQQMAFLQWPFEVLEVLTPEDVVRATSTIHDLAVLR